MIRSNGTKRLPLYGPITIPDYNNFLKESKEKFWKEYKRVSESSSQCSVTVKDFDVLKLLGKGAFGTVVLVRYLKNRNFYAMKIIEKNHLVNVNQVASTLREKRVLLSLDCPFTVRMDMFAKDNSYIYFLLPFIVGGELFHYLQKYRKFSESTALFYSAQVVLGLEYLHRLQLVYRDLKPENLLMDHNGYIKITDFGFVKPVESRTYTFCGTPVYMAPEVLSGCGYSQAVDWWALGVLIYEMTYGAPPYHAPSQIDVFKNIMNNTYKMPSYFSVPLRDLLVNLLQPDVTKRYGNLRYGANDIKRHLWFRHLPWEAISNRRVAPPFKPSIQSIENIRGEKPTFTVAEKNEFEKEFEDF